MPLPDVSEISEALSLVHLSVKEGSDEDPAMQISFPRAVDEKGRIAQDALRLHYSTKTRLPIA
jgi:hypothetical protein